MAAAPSTETMTGTLNKESWGSLSVNFWYAAVLEEARQRGNSTQRSMKRNWVSLKLLPKVMRKEVEKNWIMA
jgi:hypothetical protein